MHEVMAKGILSAKNGMNLYRGCSHGCIYCDSRSLCYGFTHPFEDIEVKVNAPELLSDALSRKRKKCMIGTGAMCDPYLHLEEKLGLTRKCLEIIDSQGFGLSILTKSDRILRDLDLLSSINEKAGCIVQMTVTTYDDELCKILEPNVCVSSRRFEVLNIMKERQIPTILWLSPILPFINDTRENIEGILSESIKASVKGIICYDMGVTLRSGSREYFYRALDQRFPGMKERYRKTYGDCYICSSPRAEELMMLFKETCRRENILSTPEACFSYLNTLPKRYHQMSLFEL